MHQRSLGAVPRGRALPWILISGLVLAGWEPLTAQELPPTRLTLGEALERAFAHSPVLRAGRAEVEETRSELLTARTYPFNPELEIAVADRRGFDDSTTDRGLTVSQELEWAGQRRQRVAAATAELTAAETGFLRRQRLLAARVEAAFAEAVRNRELLRIAEADAGLARDFLELSQRRLDAGAATQIEVNLARAASGRAQRSVELARAAYAEARHLLAEVTALHPTPPPEPQGHPPELEGELPTLEELLERAVENRADLDAFRHQRKAAEARVRLARAERAPNLNLAGFYEREEGTDRIVGAGLTISVPVLNRHRGRIARAEATLERLRQERIAHDLAVEQEVATAYANLRAARAAVEYLRAQVVGSLDDNVSLLQRSFAAGKIGATEVVIFRREFVESQREYVEAVAAAWQARIALDLATGGLAIPQTSTSTSTSTVEATP